MLSIVWKILRYRPIRTIVALCQALIGALVVTLALVLALSQSGDKSLSNLTQLTAGTRTQGGISTYGVFLPTDLSKLKNLAPDVLQIDVLGDRFVTALEVRQNRYKISGSIATGPDYPTLTGLKILYGSYFNSKDINNGAKVLALSANTARTLFGHENAVGEKLGVILDASSDLVNFRVVAVTEDASPINSNVTSPILLPVAVSGYNIKVSSLLIQSRPGRLPQTKEQLLSAAESMYRGDSQIQSAHDAGEDGFFYSPVGDLFNANQGKNIRNPIAWILYVIAGLTLMVSSLGVLSTLLVNISERTRELGIRRAIGASRFQIVLSLLLETGLTTFLGSVLGIILAIFLSPIVSNAFAITSQHSPTIVTTRLAIVVLSLFIGIGLLFGLLPALISTRLQPTEALRVQG